MKKYICILLFSLCSAVMFGQPTYQHRMDTAIDIGTHNEPFTFTDSRYTGDFTDDFHWETEYPPYPVINDLFYRITLTHSLTLKFNVTRTDKYRTNVMLLDETGKRWEYKSYSNITFGLIPGVYYFVVEGEKSGASNIPMPDATVNVQVEGVDRTTGEDFFYPFELGSFSDNFNLTPSVADFNIFRNDYRSAKDVRVDGYMHDVVYHFTLNNPMKVSLRQKGYSDEYDYSQSSLMNAAGDTICVSNSGDSNARQVELSAGEYYIYGWGRVFLGSGLFSFDFSGTVPPLGGDLFYPVEVGSRSSDFTYTDTRSTSNYPGSNQPEKAGKEANYRFTLTQPMRININTCGSAIADTYLKVFSSNRKLIFSNDNYSGTGACSNTQSACINIPMLMPGTYYVVTDAASDGNVTTSITGTVVTNPGDSFETAIDLGIHDKGFSFSDIRNTSTGGYTNRYPGKATNDVYYKFTLEKPMDVSVDHAMSSLSDTYISFLDKDGKMLYTSGNTKGQAKLDLEQLLGGTYYVVSEGMSLNGLIKTNFLLLGLGGELSTTKGQPHIISLTPLVKASNMDVLRENQQLQEIQYFDHLGQPTERIQRGITPGGNSLITLQEYDGMGREIIQWLPLPKEDGQGAYLHPSLVKEAAQETDIYGHDFNLYNETSYDGSALSRVTRQAGPGRDWYTAKRAVVTDYLTNVDALVLQKVRMYTCSGNDLKSTGYYANGSLFGVKSTDEDGNVSYEFKNKMGRVVLNRQMDGELAHDTYFVYDEYGNVRFVLPPLAADNLNSAATWNEANDFLKKYAYIYRYDKLNRCIYKKLPGCEPMYTVYDAADRPIFTQDGVQRDKGEWSFSIPDGFNRIVLMGICKNTLTYTADPLGNQVVKAAWANVTNALKGYNIAGVTLNTPTVLSAIYYDGYAFLGLNSIPSNATMVYAEVAGYGKRYSGGCRGQQTGTYTAKLGKNGTITGYLYSAMYYDERYRLIQQRGNNELGGTDMTCTAYSFTGKPVQVKLVRTVTGKETITETRQHTYDHADRLLRTTYQLNSDTPVALVDNVYDEAGRLKSELRNGNSKLKTDYVYNVRSWTKSVSGPLFSQTLNYQEGMTGNMPCYNGNISSMAWKAGTETAERGYRFTYDGLSRLRNATYGESTTLATNPNRFNEQVTGYDKMGNILGLKRYGQTAASAYGMIDDLTLTYSGNQLQAVKDAVTSAVYGNGTEFKDGANQATEYSYDKSGNLIKDLNKNISNIQYNLLNLPSLVNFGNGNSVEYEYGADGTKLRTVHKTGAVTLTTDYCGNAVYENGVLKLLLNEAGYISFPDRKYHFYLKDHQGNTRVVADKDGNVEETNAYYPFGGNFTSATGVQPYKYNGKELDTKNGLSWYDYGARHYDAAIGRWHVVDPMSEKYYSCSPYIYCLNNPIKNTDPDGRWVWAAVGAALDYGLQVYDNYNSGKSGYDAWVGNVNFVSVGLSAVNPVGKFKVLKTVAVEVARATVEYTGNDGLNVNTNVKDIAKRAAVNTAVNVGVGKLAEAASDDALRIAQKEVSVANKQVKTAERQVGRSPNSKVKAENLKEAQAGAQAARNKQVSTQILNSTVGKVPASVIEQPTSRAVNKIVYDEKK